MLPRYIIAVNGKRTNFNNADTRKLNKETENNHAEKQKLTKLDKIDKYETISETSSCNLTIDEQEETFTEICKGTTENKKVTGQETKTSTTE